MTAFARSLLREVFYGMQRGGPSASRAEEQGHEVSSRTRRAKLAKGTALLCSAASFAFNAGLGRRFFLHYHDPRALERNSFKAIMFL